MITYIMIAIAFGLIVKSMHSDNLLHYADNIGQKVGLVFIALLVGIFLGGAISAVPHALIRAGQWKSTTINENIFHHDIVSIKNDSNLSGSFFIGSGSINQTEYYVYFIRMEDGGFKRDMVQSNKAVIYEIIDENQTPKIEWTIKTSKVHWLVQFGYDQFDIERRIEGHYRIFVPKGTIIQQFNLN